MAAPRAEAVGPESARPEYATNAPERGIRPDHPENQHDKITETTPLRHGGARMRRFFGQSTSPTHNKLSHSNIRYKEVFRAPSGVNRNILIIRACMIR